MDSIWVILSLSSWYYCVNLSHNVIIIMILLFLFGARCHYHHDIIGAQWGNLMIPLYDIIVFLFLGGVFPRRGRLVFLDIIFLSCKFCRQIRWYLQHLYVSPLSVLHFFSPPLPGQNFRVFECFSFFEGAFVLVFTAFSSP